MCAKESKTRLLKEKRDCKSCSQLLAVTLLHQNKKSLSNPTV